MNHTIIFHHIPKTAGTTFHQIIDNEFKTGAYTISGNQSDHVQSVNSFIELSKEKKNNIRILKGHNVFGFHKYFDHSTDYITFIREPAQRHISGYYQTLKVRPVLPERIKFSKSPPTLEEYIINGDIYYGNNSLIKSFLNIRDPNILVTDKIFEDAIFALNNVYSFVGLTAYFDESLVLLNKKYSWNIRHYQVKNVAPNYDKISIDEDLYSLYYKYNPYDYKFYSYAKELFLNNLSLHEGDFYGDLRKLRKSNLYYNRYLRFKKNLRKLLKFK